MSLDGRYDPDNVFAKMLRGEIPTAKIFEDDEVLAFMDLFPQSKGHCLVVSKRSQARNLLEVEPERLCGLMLGVQKLTRGVRDALQPDGIVVTQFNGAPAGQTVFHLHVHVIPRWEGVPLGRHASGQPADAQELQALAKKIAAEIR